MVIFKEIAGLQQYLAQRAAGGSKIGFVPTMGALHDGHLSLIHLAKKAGLLTVCSIFLNPTQFNNPDDLAKYPVSDNEDIALLLETGCDVLFLPTAKETMETFEFGYLETVLEGAHRPGHFRGVGQVVARLLRIVQPSVLYLGQKDYQQCMVVRRLIDLLQLKELELIIAPTIREADGLAMSSRNRRLTETERILAGTIYKCLTAIQAHYGNSNFPAMKHQCHEWLVESGFSPEYIALADARDLTLLSDYDPTRPMVALIAASTGSIRLIDNLLL
ncbi:MAG: pantoate--beta-alanine ligase [Chitinophagia bacterium]|nr:pantoate--beta-alanine ligase [Chitinophagia bacterium]